jgi:tetratricopeptide (TPR) repeat protein
VGAALATIKRSVGKVLSAGDRVGTAFFVGDKYVVTALHVVADARGPRPVFRKDLTVQFGGDPIPVSVVDGFWDAAGDWAVLECTSLPTVPPLTRRSRVAEKESWDAFAYPDIQPEGKVFQGSVNDPDATLRSTKAIELFCRDVAGLGARMHGASGAPCLVDGEVVGLLRSTLIEKLIDGEGRVQIFTSAGTVYACPTAEIIDWQASRGRAILPGTWAPASITTNDFIVFLSEAENAPDAYTLQPNVERAFKLVNSSGLSAPEFHSAAAAIQSEAALVDAVRALCHARVVVFDATDFEPAIMLLVGIRAVVRRGVTILSIGGKYALGSQIDMPFNVTDANVVAHSDEQDQSEGKDSIALLAQRLRGGLQEVRSPYYLDLPVYDALRRLPPDRRGIIASDEGVLVLCSFDETYSKRVWKARLRPALRYHLERLQQDRGRRPDGSDLGVARSLDISSARLVSQALFETIRRAQSCVVDLTLWPANVLFELGVRLAASNEGTACLIDSRWEETVKPSWLGPCRSLVSMLVPAAHRYDSKRRWAEDQAFDKVFGLGAVEGAGVLGGSVHAAVERALDFRHEPAARPVYRELLDAAELFSRTPGKGGRSKPVGLFPGHESLPAREEEAEFERLLAAWYYLLYRYSSDERASAGPISDAAAEIAQSISQRHSQRLARFPETEASEIKRIARRAVMAAPRPSTVDDVRSVKLWAIAMRNLGDFDSAMKLLDDAGAALERMRSDPDLGPGAAAEVRVELADTYGMKGGVYRRHNRLHEAYGEYRKGREVEKIDEQSTYNLSNVIALGVAEERISPLERSMKADIEKAIAELNKKIGGTRTDEWWAWSDLGQLYLLQANDARALDAYERARKTGPATDEYQRHIAGLRQLLEATRNMAPDVAHAIERALSALSVEAAPSRATGV